MDPITALVIGTITKMASDDYKDIKKLIFSSEYQNMSTSERNQRLGRELASSIPIKALVTGTDSILNSLLNLLGPMTTFPVIHPSTLDSWKKNGISDELRKEVENYFYGNSSHTEDN